MTDVEELKARLLLIHDHDGNDLSVNDKRGLKDACAELDKLKRYEEREQLVRQLLDELSYCECSKRSGGNACDTCQARDAVSGFELT